MIQQINFVNTEIFNNVMVALKTDGAVKISGLNGEMDLLRLANQLGVILKNKDGQKFTRLSPTCVEAKNNQRGFTRLPLYPHTDRSPVSDPPNILILFCEKPAPNLGGASILADGLKVLQDMQQNANAHFSALQKKGSAMFCDGKTLHQGAVIEKVDNQFSIRFRFDEYGFFSGEIVDSIQILKRYIKKHSFSFGLGKGEAYVINNRRWLHGRESFEGGRIIHRLHIKAFPEMLPRGFIFNHAAV